MILGYCLKETEMRDKRDIELEFKAGDLDMIDAIMDLEKMGYSSKEAEAEVLKWEEQEDE
jgi:hypothetical protein